MEAHFQLSDEDFEQQFIDCTLDAELFSHEAHLRLAWININKYGITQAEKNIQQQLKNFVTYVGAKDKYNTTLTVAATKMVYHFILKSKSKNFKDFIIESSRLKTDFKTLVASHYSFDIFNLEAAKAEYMQPDVLPFDII